MNPSCSEPSKVLLRADEPRYPRALDGLTNAFVADPIELQQWGARLSKRMLVAPDLVEAPSTLAKPVFTY